MSKALLRPPSATVEPLAVHVRRRERLTMIACLRQAAASRSRSQAFSQLWVRFKPMQGRFGLLDLAEASDGGRGVER